MYFIHLTDGRKVEVTWKQFEFIFGHWFNPNPPEDLKEKLQKVVGFEIERQAQLNLTGYEYFQEVGRKLKEKHGKTH